MSDHCKIIIERRPFTVNRLFTAHHMVRAKLNKQWRQEAHAQALGFEPVKTPVKVFAWLMQSDRHYQDCGAMYPAVKAAIDGLVDAGVIPDDTPEYLSSIETFSPIYSPGRDAVMLVVKHDP